MSDESARRPARAASRKGAVTKAASARREPGDASAPLVEIPDAEPSAVAGANERSTADLLQRARERSPLLLRPGFLIRRLHQIHCALFMDETAEFGITPVQYSLMTALNRRGEMDQQSIAHEVGLERTTVAEVLTRLETRELVVRRPDPTDKRVRLVKLARAGKLLVKKMAPAVQRAHDRTLEPLAGDERDRLILKLIELVESNNDAGAVHFRM